MTILIRALGNRTLHLLVTAAAGTAFAVNVAPVFSAEPFDHDYKAYAAVLRAHVVDDRVNYLTLQENRTALDAVVNDLGRVTASELVEWTREQQIAYWVNAYNAFTLQVIIEHYPITRRWFNFFSPASSIKQISGVWSTLRWRAGGNEMTLDDIEHGTLRQHYDEPRIHFAVNCASISCPPLKPQPYIGEHLERQLILAVRDFLASDLGVKVETNTLHVSSMLNWFGDDFIEQYSRLVDTTGSAKTRALLGVIAKYGPRDAARVARSGNARIRFLRYDWSLNDTAARKR